MVSCLLESITQTFWLILWVKQQLTSLLYLSHCKLSHSVINVTEQSSCVINCTRDKQQNHNTSNIVIGYTAWVTHLISVQSVVTFSVFDRQKQETGLYNLWVQRRLVSGTVMLRQHRAASGHCVLLAVDDAAHDVAVATRWTMAIYRYTSQYIRWLQRAR